MLNNKTLHQLDRDKWHCAAMFSGETCNSEKLFTQFILEEFAAQCYLSRLNQRSAVLLGIPEELKWYWNMNILTRLSVIGTISRFIPITRLTDWNLWWQHVLFPTKISIWVSQFLRTHVPVVSFKPNVLPKIQWRTFSVYNTGHLCLTQIQMARRLKWHFRAKWKFVSLVTAILKIVRSIFF